MTEVLEQTVTVDGVDLNVATAGEGPAVLLLHGFPDSWQLWRHQIEALAAAGYRVVAPDLRGFGKSHRPDAVEAYDMASLLRDVVGVLDALGIERTAVVGHDWGSALAWTLARSEPDRVSALVAVSVGHPAAMGAAGPRQWARSWYMAWFLVPGLADRMLPLGGWSVFRRWAWKGVPAGADPDADRQVADLSRPGALRAALNLYRANLRPSRPGRRQAAAPSRERVSTTVSCPTMGVWSSGDAALGEDQMLGSARFVKGEWRYERIEDVDHWVPVHGADELTTLLLDFLPR